MSEKPQPRQRIPGLLLFLLLMLALLMSLCFMLLLAQLALFGEKQEWLSVSMATKLSADYRPDDWVETRFAPLQPEVINEAARDAGRDVNSSPALPEPVKPQTDSLRSIMPVFIMPVYE